MVHGYGEGVENPLPKDDILPGDLVRIRVNLSNVFHALRTRMGYTGIGVNRRMGYRNHGQAINNRERRGIATFRVAVSMFDALGLAVEVRIVDRDTGEVLYE